MDTKNGTIGGGSILSWLTGSEDKYPWMNVEALKSKGMVMYAIIAIVILGLFLMVWSILKILGAGSFRRGKGITNELDYITRVREDDARILRLNRTIQSLTKIVEASPFRQKTAEKDYMEYNLRRADVRVPGKSRVYKPEEFNAVRVTITFIIVVINLFVMLFASYVVGVISVLTVLIMSSILPNMVLRSIVKSKDAEVRENFSDFYLMLHYTLLAKSKVPLANICKSYAKTTDSLEMQKVVDVCVHYFETYGEYEGQRYIASAYREIPAMGKLMRLIRQAYSGSDVDAELIGFRQEILSDKKYAIQCRTDKLINKAKASFYILIPVLVQAVISAMGIYFKDIGGVGSFI